MLKSLLTRSKSRVRRPLVFTFLIFLAAYSLAAQEQKKPSILLIHSYHQGHFWTDRVSDGVKDILRARGLIDRLQIEYVDSQRYPSAENRANFINYITERAQAHDFQIIISSDDEALKLAVELRPRLFPMAPIVFCAISEPYEDIVGKQTDITGILRYQDPQAALNVIKLIQPNLRELFLLMDNSSSGLESEKEIRLAARATDVSFKITTIPYQSIEQTIFFLERVPKKSAVLLLDYNRDSKGKWLQSEETGALFARPCRAPIYTMDGNRFSGGVLGGSMLSGNKQGEDAASIALQILGGKKPEEIPVLDKPVSVLGFDYRVMRRFGLPISRLPKHAILVNRSQFALDRYQLQLSALIGFSLLLLLLSGSLMANILKRKNAEAALSRLAVILEATTDLVCTASIDLKINYLNGSGRQLLGWTGISKKTIEDSMPPEAFAIFKEESLPTVEHSGRWTGETIIRTQDGRLIPVSQVLMLHAGKTMRQRYISTVMRDISGRISTEEALRKSEENLRITLDSIGDAVVVTDAQGRVTRMNPVAENLALCTQEEAAGRSIMEILNVSSDDGKNILSSPVDYVIKEGKPAVQHAVPRVLTRHDGSRRSIADSAAPIRDRDGKVLGAVLVLRDVSQEMELQERLRQNQRMEVIGQLSAGIAHDFNNILTAILGSAQLISMNLPSGSEEQGLSVEIVDAAIRASELTKQLVAFSHKSPMRMEPVKLHDIVNEVSTLLEHSIDKLISINVELGAACDRVIGDPVMLHSSLLNLGLNARDAMPDGGELQFATRNVELSAEDCAALGLVLEPGHYLELAVSDTGLGMPTEVCNRIFEPYFNAKASGRGKSMNLATVYSCIQNHKGQIKVRSLVDLGSVFTIYLPLSNADEEMEKPSEAPTSQHGLKAGQGHILLIDDEESIRRTTAAILKKAGYRVSLAENGIVGMELYSATHEDIDLVLLDMIMPKMSGREVFHKLKAVNPHVKVFLYSAYAQHQVIEELIQDGALGLLPKPFRMEELTRMLSAALRP